jgi:hypothetical protein
VQPLMSPVNDRLMIQLTQKSHRPIAAEALGVVGDLEEGGVAEEGARDQRVQRRGTPLMS